MTTELEAPSSDLIRVSGAHKRYGGVIALKGVNLTIRRGEIHALVGENGAGKSTLGKIIAGAVTPDGGGIEVNGRAVRYKRPSEAIRDGIAMIDQELAILPHRSVLDNVFLGTENGRLGVLNRRVALSRFHELASRFGFEDVDPRAIAGALRVADQQRVEIMRALSRGADLIVMDEPTAPLSRVEAQNLHSIMRDLRAQGTTIVFVSHFLEEVLELSDRVTIMKDGAWVRTSDARAETKDTLVLGMLGRKLESIYPTRGSGEKASETSRLALRNVSIDGVIENICIDLRPGEIVGLAGLVGSGRTETARAAFGADRISDGSVLIDGQEVRLRSPLDAIRAGIALVPESRKTQGLYMGRSVRENITAAALPAVSTWGTVRKRREDAAIARHMEALSIKAGSVDIPVSALSGGNQQKVALARSLMRDPKVLIVDEPTRGVDIGAKASIYEALRSVADEGKAVLVISSELEEVLGLSDRLYVMNRGRIVGEFAGDLLSQEEAVLAAAFGQVDRSVRSDLIPLEQTVMEDA